MFHSLQYHKTLAPKIWNPDETINQLFSQSVQTMVFGYIKYLSDILKLPITSKTVQDIILHGSLANYYWDKHSDIDVMVILDFTEIRRAFPNLNEKLFFSSLFRIYKGSFQTSLFGRSIDVMLFDYDELVRSRKCNTDTLYSLMHERWVIKPRKLSRSEFLKTRRIARKKYTVIMRQCRYILKNKMSHEFISTYLVTLKQLRHNSVRSQPDLIITSTQMAFKMVRNTGIFDKLHREAQKQRSRVYTLK